MQKTSFAQSLALRKSSCFIIWKWSVWGSRLGNVKLVHITGHYWHLLPISDVSFDLYKFMCFKAMGLRCTYCLRVSIWWKYFMIDFIKCPLQPNSFGGGKISVGPGEGVNMYEVNSHVSTKLGSVRKNWIAKSNVVCLISCKQYELIL